MVLPSFSPRKERGTYIIEPDIVHAELIFGVTSQRCRGNGICSMYTKGSIKQEKAFCNFATVEIKCDANENLLFAIQKDSMRQSTILKYFSQPTFIIEEDFMIPGFIIDFFSIKRKIISIGGYNYYEFKNNYYVLFPNKI